MRKFLFFVLSVILPFLFLIPLTNYFVDPAHIYNDNYEKRIIEGFIHGKSVTNVTNMDERLFKRLLIELHKNEHFDYVILGPSQVMTISEEALTGEKILNLAVSACTIEDYISLFEICKQNNLTFETAILGVQPVLFNPNNNDNRWKTNSIYYYQFLDLNSKFELKSEYENLLSFSYFGNSINSLFQKKADLEFTYNKTNKGATQIYDGSMSYDENYRNRPQQIIDEESKIWMHSTFEGFTNLSNDKIKQYELFLKQIKEKAHVIYFFTPFHPYFYERICKTNGMILGQKYLEESASLNNIPVIGDYDPTKCGFDNHMFYDAAHSRKEVINDYISDKIHSLCQ